jgi:hypothetical protein
VIRLYRFTLQGSDVRLHGHGQGLGSVCAAEWIEVRRILVYHFGQ